MNQNNPKTYQYTTIQEPKQYEIDKIKKSRFIGFAYPIQTPEQAKEIIAKHQKEYHNATHNCWAYNCTPRLHFDLFDQAHVQSVHHKNSDDGEPGGTAGYPIQMAIMGAQLHNVLIIVTRYYGGTMLGRGGLTQAYGETAKQVVEQAKKISVPFEQEIIISFAHDDTGMVMHYIKQYNAKIIQDTTDIKRTIHLCINKAYSQKAVETMKDTGKIAVKII